MDRVSSNADATFDDIPSAREILDHRYDELASGKVGGIDGEEAFQRLMEKTQARRQRRPA